MPDTPTSTPPIRDLLTRKDIALTPAEMQIAQTLLADYPVSGLGTAASLAKRAGVSDPTVIRLVSKLGFDGFAAFQARLLGEVEAGLRSPVMMMGAKQPTARGRSIAATYLHSVATTIQSMGTAALPQTYERAAKLIMGAKGRVLVVGGRFSRYVAGMLAAYLGQLRPRVVSLSPVSSETFDALLDADARDVLIAFDYRRYQTDVIHFCEQAQERGVSLILFTDPYKSPLAEKARVVLTASGEVDSPYDSLAPPVAQIEALLAYLIADDSSSRDTRVRELDRIHEANAVTVRDAGASGGGSKKKRGAQP